MVSVLSPSTHAQIRVEEDIAELRKRFEPWRGRYEHWMKFAFPYGGHAQVMANLGTLFDAGSVQSLEDKRSRYVSEWVGTRGEVLTSRRTRATTNILSASYGNKDGPLPENEKLVEFAMGIFSMLDRQKVRGMGGFGWDYQLKQMGTWTGKEAFVVRVYESRSTSGARIAKVEAPFIDPFSLCHDIDTLEGEQHRIIRDFTVRWEDLPRLMQRWTAHQDRLPPPIMPRSAKSTDLVTITDYWRRDPDGDIFHSIMIDGGKNSQGGQKMFPVREVVEWSDHGYGQTPIVVSSRPAATHGFHDGNGGGLDAQVAYHAEPFYARAIPLLVFKQGLESLAADGAALAALPIFTHRKGTAGRGVQKKDLKPFAFLEMATDEQLDVMRNIQDGRITVDTALARNAGELNEVWPDFLVSPGVLPNVAGYSFNSQIGQAKMYMVPWTRMDEVAKDQLLALVIDQHVSKHAALPFLITGIMPHGGKASRKFVVGDYPKGDFEIEIQEPAEIPGEALQKANMAKQMTDGERPFVSMWQARVDLGIGQPHREQERIDDEAYARSPEKQSWNNLQRLGKDINEFRDEAKKHKAGTPAWLAAQVAAGEGEKILAAKMAQLSGAPQTGFTQPAEPGNPPPEALPAQETIDNPNDEALANNRPPTGTTGRPR
jgi:hypothetical protein